MAILLTLSSGQAVALNDSGETVGTLADAFGQHSFVYFNGTYTVLDVPGASATTATTVGDTGEVAGYYRDATGIHGFVYNNAFTTISAPGAINTFITSIDAQGGMTGYVMPTTHGFILSDNV